MKSPVMRPGDPRDLPRLADLWRSDVREGRQDSALPEMQMQKMLARFDWEAKSRVVDRDGGDIAGAVLVTSRATPQGDIATLHAAGPAGVSADLVGWGLRLAKAAGAVAANLFVGHGYGEAFKPLGLEMVRPWWRMDRSLREKVSKVEPLVGYTLIDGNSVRPGSWGQTFNRSFADHWRFSPRSEEELTRDKAPELCLMALTAPAGLPVAITQGQIESYVDDPRPQPVGLVSSVGTVPEHRRRGLATWLVAETLSRFKDAGARHASLYVDGWSRTRAFDAYGKLGFEVAFEAEVWEASFS
jgi:ribosomal protein S18 acetylase RimI-like enzyme